LTTSAWSVQWDFCWQKWHHSGKCRDDGRRKQREIAGSLQKVGCSFEVIMPGPEYWLADILRLILLRWLSARLSGGHKSKSANGKPKPAGMRRTQSETSWLSYIFAGGALPAICSKHYAFALPAGIVQPRGDTRR